jgi:rhodanese-related sulfurtransferase
MRWLSLLLTVTLVYGAGLEWLQGERLNVMHTDGKRYVITRYVPKECRGIPILPENVWARKGVPAGCLQPLVTTVGVISTIDAAEGVQTFGELETMAFLKAMRPDGRKMLLDSRSSDWYERETIPGAINLWYKVLIRPTLFPEEFDAFLEQLKIARSEDGTLDFSKAPELLLFCNGPWCSQSPNAIKALLRLGYPAEKLKWYRGGMHDWKSLAMTTTARQPR